MKHIIHSLESLLCMLGEREHFYVAYVMAGAQVVILVTLMFMSCICAADDVRLAHLLTSLA